MDDNFIDGSLMRSAIDPDFERLLMALPVGWEVYANNLATKEPTNMADNTIIEQDGTLEMAMAAQDQQSAAASAEDRKQMLIEQSVSQLTAQVSHALIDLVPTPIGLPAGRFYNVGTDGHRVLFVADDGTVIEVRIQHNRYVGTADWQRFGAARARANGHDPLEWVYAGHLGYASSCAGCGALMAVDTNKRPYGDQLNRTCTESYADRTARYEEDEISTAQASYTRHIEGN